MPSPGYYSASGPFFLPILYGILGFVVGLIGVLLYNGIAHLLGGIEIELEETRHAVPAFIREIGVATN